MPHVVTGRCVDCKYTDCCTVCPVDCFYEIDDPKMLVIDPETCIDCQLCVPECPIHAIYEEEELPDAYKDWTGKNKELFTLGKVINTRKDALPGARTLEQIQSDEKSRGLNVAEPRNS